VCELAVELAARAVKAIVGRPRPPYDDAIEHLANSALPSAHVARVTVLVTLLVYLVPRRRRLAAVVIGVVVVLAVAYARMYLGSHWFTDTLVAWPFGLGAVLLAQKLTGGAFSRSTVGNGQPADAWPVS
jgi:undecaprenyl-diphosphatase